MRSTAQAGGEHPFRARSIALPAEHGSWGLILEPIALGLGVAPSAGGVLIAAGVLAGFLLRRPLKILLGSRRETKDGRKNAAARIAALYGVSTALFLAGALACTGPEPFLSMLGASPLLLLVLFYDFSNRSRAWQAEIAAVGFAATVAGGIAQAGGIPAIRSLALAGIVAARSVSAVLYIRARIRLDRNRGAGRSAPVSSHIVSLAAVTGGVAAGLVPIPTISAFTILLLRAMVGLSPLRRRGVSIKKLGFVESAYGILTVTIVATGHHAGMYVS